MGENSHMSVEFDNVSKFFTFQACEYLVL